MMPFCARYPNWPDNVERHRVNGPLQFGREPLKQSLRKIVKSTLSLTAARETLFLIAGLLERITPKSSALERVYRLLLGAHIFRGYRAGLTLYLSSEGRPAKDPGMNKSNLVGEFPVKN
jgi:hypothetical protein